VKRNEISERLRQYGGRMILVDGRRTVQLVDPNDNAHRRFQYRLRARGGIERRILRHDGQPFIDTNSPWEPLSQQEEMALQLVRGEWHPILDPLGL
jgi:hypothetical protein